MVSLVMKFSLLPARQPFNLDPVPGRAGGGWGHALALQFEAVPVQRPQLLERLQHLLDEGVQGEADRLPRVRPLPVALDAGGEQPMDHVGGGGLGRLRCRKCDASRDGIGLCSHTWHLACVCGPLHMRMHT